MTKSPAHPPTARENGNPKIPDPTRQLAILNIVIVMLHSPDGKNTADFEASMRDVKALSLRLSENESTSFPDIGAVLALDGYPESSPRIGLVILPCLRVVIKP
mmetsp:Transcript_16667/g.32550  ORF Transcript_16667/g.32550 Transcript_16667/m.32550 type:complete len:103 (+) Transcript_16667:1333-1641(+)